MALFYLNSPNNKDTNDFLFLVITDGSEKCNPICQKQDLLLQRDDELDRMKSGIMELNSYGLHLILILGDRISFESSVYGADFIIFMLYLQTRACDWRVESRGDWRGHVCSRSPSQ